MVSKIWYYPYDLTRDPIFERHVLLCHLAYYKSFTIQWILHYVQSYSLWIVYTNLFLCLQFWPSWTIYRYKFGILLAYLGWFCLFSEVTLQAVLFSQHYNLSNCVGRSRLTFFLSLQTFLCLLHFFWEFLFFSSQWIFFKYTSLAALQQSVLQVD